jgi:N1-acetylpolyamine oxidase
MQLLVKQESHLNYETVIIGAGIAGLACAARLRESAPDGDERRIVVLEARDRIGGRIGSVDVDGNRLDTGANWIHGTDKEGSRNPILDFVPELHFRELRSSVAFRAPVETSAPGEDLVIPSSVSSDLFSNLWQLLQSLHERTEELSPEAGRDTSILDTILRDQRFRGAFKSIPEKYHASLAGLPQMLEGMEAAPLNDQSAETPEDSPGMSMLEYATDGFEGKQVFLRDGYISVINNLAKRVIASELIELNTEVLQIHWDQTPIKVVTTGAIYTANNVVCTLPLGVLRHQLPQKPSLVGATSDDSLFAPALPSDKLDAIASLGFGTLDKIFMVYQSPWWKETPFSSVIEKGITTINPQSAPPTPSEPDGFRGFSNELRGIYITPHGLKSGPCGLFLVNLHTLTGYPVLAAFVSCANARRIEALTDQEAGAIVHRALTDWFGGIEPPAPKAVHVTRWAQDPYSRGSYSHMVTGKSKRQHREAFATPIVNAAGSTMRFAGEHTSLEDFATVHGALLSGWREADALLAAGDHPSE